MQHGWLTHRRHITSGWLIVMCALIGCNGIAMPKGDSGEGDATPPATSIRNPQANAISTPQKWRDAFTEAMRSGRYADVDRLIDWESLESRALSNISLPNRLRTRWVEVHFGALRKQGMLGKLAVSVSDGDAFGFVRHDDSHSLARYATRSGQVIDFQRWTLKERDGGIVATDVAFFTAGEPLSRTLRRAALRYAVKKGIAKPKGLSEWDEAIWSNTGILDRIDQSVETGHFVEVIEDFAKLPQRLRRDRYYAFRFLRAVAKAERFLELFAETKGFEHKGNYQLWTKIYEMFPRGQQVSAKELLALKQRLERFRLPSYADEIERLRDASGHPEEIDVLAFAGFAMREDNAGMVATIERLLEVFPNDPQLLTMLGELQLKFDSKLATRTFRKAIAIDGDWPPPQWGLTRRGLKVKE